MEDFAILNAHFSSDEIYRALCGIGPIKVPGLDGFHAFYLFIYFQKYWGFVGHEVIMASLDVLNIGAFLSSINATNVVLIPKKKSLESVADFRPISLCNVVYKVVSKTIANRLKRVLPSIISNYQSAFVPGRLITNNVILATEQLHSLHKRNNGRKGFMALKLNMNKAYDRVEWVFVRKVMEKMDFPSQWVALVQECISTARFAFCVNGSPIGQVIPSRGIRQGCSLSPYLFLLCAEALSSSICVAEMNGSLLGWQCSRAGPRISHLFFCG